MNEGFGVWKRPKTLYRTRDFLQQPSHLTKDTLQRRTISYICSQIVVKQPLSSVAVKALNDKNATMTQAKKGHQVLVFGRVFPGQLPAPAHPNADIKFTREYKDLGRLTEYSLVIVDYAEFESSRGQGSTSKQTAFVKQMFEGLRKGTFFCFVFFDENVPTHDEWSSATGHMDKGSMDELARTQIGYRWLNYRNIRPIRSEDAIPVGDVKRQEFLQFFNKWGVSHMSFRPYGDGKIDDPIVTFGNDNRSLGFALKCLNSYILYLPFQRDHIPVIELVKALEALVDGCLSYATNIRSQLPEWAESAFFEEEVEIYATCDKLEKSLDAERKKLDVFQEAKSLLFKSQYELEEGVPEFIQQRLLLNTYREEKFKEDFWILDEKGQRTVLVEVKSVTKGFRKSLIYATYAHREENKLEENFPTLLIVNSRLQAGSWSDKDKQIDKQDYEIAAQNHVLVLRVEDLVRLWRMIEHRLITSAQILDHLRTKLGWLEVTRDWRITERK